MSSSLAAYDSVCNRVLNVSNGSRIVFSLLLLLVQTSDMSLQSAAHSTRRRQPHTLRIRERLWAVTQVSCVPSGL